MRERGANEALLASREIPRNEDLAVIRVVCRNGFSKDLADLLLADVNRLLPELHRQPGPMSEHGVENRTAFHH